MNPTVDVLPLRAYFAARAPVEIPSWFKHVEPEKKFPPMPNYRTLDEVHQPLALNWQQDPCYDLPEEIAWYGEKVIAHRAGRADWNNADARARYVQWRFAYADAMLGAM